MGCFVGVRLAKPQAGETTPQIVIFQFFLWSFWETQSGEKEMGGIDRFFFLEGERKGGQCSGVGGIVSGSEEREEWGGQDGAQSLTHDQNRYFNQ